MGEASKRLFEGSHWDEARHERKAAGESAVRALRHASDILLGRKKPSRDPSTWNDRTGEQDAELDRDEAVKRRREHANTTAVRG
jgi:hypothetical protein